MACGWPAASNWGSHRQYSACLPAGGFLLDSDSPQFSPTLISAFTGPLLREHSVCLFIHCTETLIDRNSEEISYEYFIGECAGPAALCRLALVLRCYCNHNGNVCISRFCLQQGCWGQTVVWLPGHVLATPKGFCRVHLIDFQKRLKKSSIIFTYNAIS